MLFTTEVQEVHGYNFSTEITAEDFAEHSIRTSKSTLSIHEKAISFRVADLKRSYGFCSKQQLLGYARSIENFPILEKEINKHYEDFPQYKMSHMTRKSFTSAPTLHSEALKIGDMVSTDCIKFSESRRCTTLLRQEIQIC